MHVEDARKLGRRILTDTKFLAAVRIALSKPDCRDPAALSCASTTGAPIAAMCAT